MSHKLLGTEMYGAGSNVGSRADTMQVSNVNANHYWYTETVYSKNRDFKLYPTPSQYRVPLSRKYKRVLEVELLSAQIPISPYVIECSERLGGPSGPGQGAGAAGIETKGNNSLRFNEGYIIDDGAIYGICNDRVTVREYTDPVLGACGPVAVPAGPSCGVLSAVGCGTSTAQLPHTLTPIESVEILAEGRIRVVTTEPHHFTTKYCSRLYLADRPETSEVLHLEEIVDARTFIATASHGSDSCTDAFGTGGWVVLPRISSPHLLAEMVQDYLNQRACPPARNAYSVTFNDDLGRFVFTRSFGVCLFDLLAGSDDRSILSATMGFSAVDYYYGQYNHLTDNQTRLTSEMLETAIRPDIISESVGESALVAVPRGNYLPATTISNLNGGGIGTTGLAETLTREMQRPLLTDANNLLVAQVLGQVVKIQMPCGMYTPQNLAAAIAEHLNWAYAEITGPHGRQVDKFTGRYNHRDGAFLFDSDEPFGLLFSCSTIGPLLGFEQLYDMTGNSSYSSLNSVFFPVTNQRYTDQIYRVTAQSGDLTFRFTKSGTYQAPIVHVAPSDDAHECPEPDSAPQGAGVQVFTWTAETGGCAHGFQVGDVMTIEGIDDIETVPPFNGIHVVRKVYDAYSFELALKLITKTSTPCPPSDDSTDGNNGNNGCARDDTPVLPQCFLCRCGQEKSCKCRASSAGRGRDTTIRQFSHVASHWSQPFCLFFPGVKNTISEVLGFPRCLSGCEDYVGANQWNLLRQRDVYMNIQELSGTDNGRICKTSNSGPNSKYQYSVHNSYVRVPLSFPRQEGLEFGLLSSSSYQRKHRFTLNSRELSDLSISLVDECGDLVNFHGREHAFDLRILVES